MSTATTTTTTTTTPAPVDTPAPESKAGRGQKTCPACQKIVGSRTHKCECGHEFPVNQTAKPTVNLGEMLKLAMKIQAISPEDMAILEKHLGFVQEVGGVEEFRTLVAAVNAAVAA